MYQTIYTASNDYLMHHGVKGQKWGIRRYQNADGSLTAEGRKRYDDALYGGKTLRKWNKQNKKMYKESVKDFKINNRNASKIELNKYKSELRNNMQKMQEKYIAENVNEFRKKTNSVAAKSSIIGAAALGAAAITKIGTMVLSEAKDSPAVYIGGTLVSAALTGTGLGTLAGTAVGAIGGNMYYNNLEKKSNESK